MSTPRTFTSEESVSIGYGCDWPDAAWADLVTMLEAAKKAAGEEDSETPGWATIRGGWQVAASGARLGGAGGPQARFRVVREGITVLVMARQTPHDSTPNVYASASALACLALGGLAGAAEGIREGLRTLGLALPPRFELLSRVDVFADLEGLETGRFNDALTHENIISRATKTAAYAEGRKKTGITVGSGAISVRCYDKVHELKRSPVKAAAWSVTEWGGKPPEVASRVEFQLRREALKQLGCNTVAEFVENRPRVVAYLTRQWFRIVEPGTDRTHTTRATVSDLWEAVRRAFDSTEAKPQPRKVVRSEVNRKALGLQAMGCLARAALTKAAPRLTTFEGMLTSLISELEDRREDIRGGMEGLCKRIAKDHKRRWAFEPLVQTVEEWGLRA